MKNMITGFLSILLILVMIPIISTRKPADKTASVSASAEDNSAGLIAEKAAECIENGYCDEAVKAVIIILQTNYKYDKKLISSNKSKNNNSKTEKYAKELKGRYIRYKNKIVPVPYFRYSAGYTQTGKKYPYIKNAASPWDSLKNQSNTTGVSLNGLNELCKRGLGYKEALSWYLKDVVIG